MKWHTIFTTSLTAMMLSLPVHVQSASAETFTLSENARTETFQWAQDRRSSDNIQDLKRDPARAALLSALYPGLGHLYIGNDNSRSLWIMGGGTLVIAGSFVGYGLLSNRPEEAKGLGNTLITAALVGYHLWNVRDAFVQATDYNRSLESRDRFGLLPELQLSPYQDSLVLAWQFDL